MKKYFKSVLLVSVLAVLIFGATSAKAAVPVVESITPTEAAWGPELFTLTVNGSSFVVGNGDNFRDNTTRSRIEIRRGVNGTQVNGGNMFPTTATTNQLTLRVVFSTLQTGTYTIKVFNPGLGGGMSTSSATIRVVSQIPPTVTGLSPGSIQAVSPDTTITVTGTGFVENTAGTGFSSNASVVRFNGENRTTSYVSGTVLTAVIPGGALRTVGNRNVAVYNAGPQNQRGTSLDKVFRVRAVGEPYIEYTDPLLVLRGTGDTVVLLNGGNFLETSIVSLRTNNMGNLTPVPLRSFTDTENIVVIIPQAQLTSAKLLYITVSNPASTLSTVVPAIFRVNNPSPTINTISPAEVVASAGATFQTITLTGTNFMAGTNLADRSRVRITTIVNGRPVITYPPLIFETRNSIVSIVFTLPNNLFREAGDISITVVNPDPSAGPSDPPTVLHVTARTSTEIDTSNSTTKNVPPACVDSDGTIVKLSRNLKVGSIGRDVGCIQAILGVFPITSYFGPITLANIQTYQNNEFGYYVNHVGPATIAKLNEILESEKVTSLTPTINSKNTSPIVSAVGILQIILGLDRDISITQAEHDVLRNELQFQYDARNINFLDYASARLVLLVIPIRSRLAPITLPTDTTPTPSPTPIVPPAPTLIDPLIPTPIVPPAPTLIDPLIPTPDLIPPLVPISPISSNINDRINLLASLIEKMKELLVMLK